MRPWKSRPSRGLVLGVAACVGIGALLPFTPLAGMIVVYLAAAEIAKRRFYRHAGI